MTDVVSQELMLRRAPVRKHAQSMMRTQALQDMLPDEAVLSERDGASLTYDLVHLSIERSAGAEIAVSAIAASAQLRDAAQKTRLPLPFLGYADLRGVGEQLSVRMTTQAHLCDLADRYAQAYAGEQLRAPFLFCGPQLHYNADDLIWQGQHAPTSLPIYALGTIADSEQTLRRMEVRADDLTLEGVIDWRRGSEMMGAAVMDRARSHGMHYIASMDETPYVELFFTGRDPERIVEVVSAFAPRGLDPSRLRRVVECAHAFLDGYPSPK